MLARSCGFKEEALSLCKIAENRYKVMLKHPSVEMQMTVAYSNAAISIDNIRTIISDDSFWSPESTLNFSDLLFDNDTNSNTESV